MHHCRTWPIIRIYNIVRTTFTIIMTLRGSSIAEVQRAVLEKTKLARPNFQWIKPQNHQKNIHQEKNYRACTINCQTRTNLLWQAHKMRIFLKVKMWILKTLLIKTYQLLSTMCSKRNRRSIQRPGFVFNVSRLFKMKKQINVFD